MRRHLLVTGLFCTVMTMISLSGQAAEKPQAKLGAAPHIELLSDATMDKLQKLGAPSKEQSILSSIIGIWDYDLKFWDGKSDGPQLSTGTVTNEMILGGRFLSRKTSLVLNIGGQNIPYEGWNILGYDTLKKTYTSVLIDTLHTGTVIGTAAYNDKTKTLEEIGRFTHPLIDKERTYRSELQFTNSDEYKQTIFIESASGKETKILELDFHRQH